VAQWRNDQQLLVTGYWCLTSLNIAEMISDMINRPWVQFLYSGQKLHNNFGQVVYTYVPVTKQYNLVPA